MQWNGIDPNQIHRAVRRSTEYIPAKMWDIRTIETTKGAIIAYAKDEQSEYATVLNIAAKSAMEAEEAMEAIRTWAMGGGGIHELMPTGSPEKVYDGICKSISQPNLKRGVFGTCEVRWTLANPNKRSAVQSRAATQNATSLSVWVSGTGEADMQIEIIPKAAAATLSLALDGNVFFVRNGRTAAGQKLLIQMGTGTVTLDGADAAPQTDWQQTDYDRPLTHGRHTLTCSTAADITVRWYDRWV